MKGVFDVPAELEPLQAWVFAGLEATAEQINAALASDVPAVTSLTTQVERFRGKMLRPTLVMLSGAACGTDVHEPPPEDLVKVAAVVETVHMATLVHDDVLDDADTRRGGATINRTRGNETAVILGDYLIAAAFHLCSTLPTQEPSRLIGRVAMELCAGELLQLDNRDNLSLDEATYFEILEGKTASLAGACCKLGGMLAANRPEQTAALDRFGRRIGAAFQVQDDVLDLTGDEAVVGKTLGRDLKKGKLTLPLIKHLSSLPADERGDALASLEAVSESGGDDDAVSASVAAALHKTGSVEASQRVARDLIDDAQAALSALPDSPARTTLGMIADAVLTRDK
ncbi:MAG: polyprenyl synthetase family protein [Planctomycetota bacterium]